jgi:hypothetical protein
VGQEYFNSKHSHDTSVSNAGDGTDCYILVMMVFDMWNEVVTALTMKIVAFWRVMVCGLVDVYWCFRVKTAAFIIRIASIYLDDGGSRFLWNIGSFLRLHGGTYLKTKVFVLSHWRYISVNFNICIMCIAITINPKRILGDFAVSVVIRVQYLLSDRYYSGCHEPTSVGSTVCSAAMNLLLLWCPLSVELPWTDFCGVHCLFSYRELTSVRSTVCSAAMNRLLWGLLSVKLSLTDICGVCCPAAMNWLLWRLLSVHLLWTDFCGVCCLFSCHKLLL